jgi:hypothetical protein
MNEEQMQAYRNYILMGSAASWYAWDIGYLFTLTMVELSILVFYLSFATQRKSRILVYICIAILAAVSVVMILIVTLQCPKKPLSALTVGVFVPRGRTYCWELWIVLYWQSCFNIASDLVILVMPMPLLFCLRMHKTKRWSLVAVFSVGLLVPIAFALRFWVCLCGLTAARWPIFMEVISFLWLLFKSTGVRFIDNHHKVPS